MSQEFQATPWMRNAVLGAGLTLAAVRARIPAGYDLFGHARSPRGPYTLTLRNGSAEHVTEAQTWKVLPDALDRLFAKVGVEA